MIATLYALGPWTQGPQTEQRKTSAGMLKCMLSQSWRPQARNSSVAEPCSLKIPAKRPSYLSSSWGLQLFLRLWLRQLATPLRLLLSALMRTSLALRPTWIIQERPHLKVLNFNSEDPFHLHYLCLQRRVPLQAAFTGSGDGTQGFNPP